jgi:endonuclease-3
MSTNRAALFGKLQKVLKKHYKPVIPAGDRPLLEQLLYACCLENSRPEAADEAFAKLQLYADWNEVRVTSVTELAEVLAALTDPANAARRLKQTLQSVFETKYTFELDAMKKGNLGKAIKDLEGFKGVTPFVVAYASQHGLGGHSIPANRGVYGALISVGAITTNEAASGRIPGLERAVPKSKGVEFASLLHQLGVDFETMPYASKLRGILQEINPDAELPKKEKERDKERAAEQQAKAASSREQRQRRPAKTPAEPERTPAKRKAMPPQSEPAKARAKAAPAKPITKKKPK